MSPGKLKKISIAAAWIGVLIILQGCGSMFEQRLRRLDPPEVHSLFAGHTVTSRNLKTGTESISYYFPEGTVHQYRNGRLRTGVWRVLKDGRICMAMQSREESCRIVKVDPDDVYRKYEPGGLNSQALIVYTSFARGNQLHRITAPASQVEKKAYDIASLQRLLLEAGYLPGPIDGKWGPRSRQALLEYQKDKGLPRTGRPSRELFEHFGLKTPLYPNWCSCGIR
jgi:hypothetical protein